MDKLTKEEREAIIKELKSLSLSIIHIALILEGAEQGYYGGKLETEDKDK